MELAKRPNFTEYEPRIYQEWENAKVFTPKIDPSKKPFCIIMPPPNANGSLHVGHALFLTLQDIMTRYHRMAGDVALLLPGADHAGILTQVVFERALAKKNKTRFDLGREEFYRQCYEFSQTNKETMYGQFKKLGTSCDWSREKFTLEPELVKVAERTFIKLFQEKYAYRGERMINWCPRCATALSDLEVEYHEDPGTLWYFKYPLTQPVADITHITVATTRPETMLGDTAVAINPKDKRYRKLVGHKIRLPIMEREIPVVADDVVDPEFGTGAVKVTPAHDPVDFEIGQRHDLIDLQAIVIGFDDRMTSNAGRFAGQEKLQARKAVVEEMEKLGLLANQEPYTHRVGHCERCKTVVEPLISRQWFIAMHDLAQTAINAVRQKKTKIIPVRFEKTYYQWLENIHDWCVSRQLWWGPRLPVWYCGIEGLSELQKIQNPELIEQFEHAHGCGEVVVASTQPDTPCKKCGQTAWIQDPDTFDTWFLSGQWPYTTLGFEQGSNLDHQPDFKYFYPTSVMETGYEILFFWVARMIMLGIYRTGQIPFKIIYLHGLVRDAFGEKMSKSKGNVINPLDVVEQYGADALRMALISGISPGNDSKLSDDKILGYRNFVTKLWNIARFVIGQNTKIKDQSAKTKAEAKKLKLEKEDKAILDKLNTTTATVTKSLEQFRFAQASETIYNFVWHEFADVYIEAVKPRLYESDNVESQQTAIETLTTVLTVSLKLLHPFMPFVTEEIYQKLPDKDAEFLAVAPWPTQVDITRHLA